jgi:carboxymethylenebutenolidase
LSMSPEPQNISVPSSLFDIPATLFVPPAAGASAAPPSEANGAPAASASPSDASAANTVADAAPPYPALVVLHDIHGLDDATREAAARLSRLGYVCLAPDLFARSGGPQDTSSETALMNFTLSLSDAQMIADALAALSALTSRDDVDANRLGIVGWGWGGAFALMAAAHDHRAVVACDIGGDITYPVLTPQKPGSPLNFLANIEGALFAAYPGGDPAFPPIEIERLRTRLIEHDKPGEVKIYDGAPPRFWRDGSLPQTASLWRRLENFLLDYLIHTHEPAFIDPYGLPEDGYPNEESRLHA